MTDDNYTALLLIVDRSDSMTTIRDDMVGGLQKLLDQQAAEPVAHENAGRTLSGGDGRLHKTSNRRCQPVFGLFGGCSLPNIP